MRIERHSVGVTHGHSEQPGLPVESYTLGAGDLTVTVWTYGATLVELEAPSARGSRDNLVLRLPSLRAYEDRNLNPYLGCTMGRFARCIGHGRFELDGREHRVTRNFGAHHFHGGSIGFDRFVWRAEAYRDGDSLALCLSLERPDGDQGYPGSVSVHTLYRLHRNGALELSHRATCTASTPIGLTNHSFWNLAGAGTIEGHRLAVAARRVIAVDAELIPQGPPLDVSGSTLDYHDARAISDARLDHCFWLDGAAPAAVLSDPGSGRVMRLETNQSGLAVYSADGLAKPRTGLCLQTGALPDAPNRPDFPSSRLDPGETYAHDTTLHFSIGGTHDEIP